MTFDTAAPEPTIAVPSLRPLVLATAANYLWQLPYAVHQYGWGWTGLPRLSIALLLSGVFFAVAAHRWATGRRYGRAMLLTFLAAEALFYLVHNLSGAFLADLPVSNLVLLVASMLGYLNVVVATTYLFLLRRAR